MKHLIVGDIHGFHHNLRKFLVTQGVVNKKGQRINRDEIKVYSVGDLIDGDVNRQGDILNLEYAPDWFDAVCLGNHEYAFLGGKEFGGRRKHDRKTMRLLLNLIDQGIYVPSALAHGHLITHAGLAAHFGFETAEDAHEYITQMWQMAPDFGTDLAVFDWTGKSDASYGDPTSGVFCLDWTDIRNSHFPQVVGHTTYYTGPVEKDYPNGIVHWNVDIGAKVGKGVGGIIIDDVANTIKPIAWGDRHLDSNKVKKMYPPQGEKTQIKIEGKDKTPTFLAPGLAKPNSTPSQVTHTGATGGSIDADAPTVKEGAELRWNDLPVTSLDDVEISVIDDPAILAIYKEELGRGNDIRLKDLIARDGVLH